MKQVKTYYQLTKPGIIYGNVLTTIAGFFLASRGKINLELFITTLIGVSLVIASACVFNNLIDRSIDRKMERTQNRALVTNTISPMNAVMFAIILGVLGFASLIIFTNLITCILGLIGFFDYIVLYGLSKRTTIHGTIIGSVSGAVPIAAGYTSVTNRFDVGALLLFLIMMFWQMPHFYAIAMHRKKDYAAAGLPVLPVKKGSFPTKVQILLYLTAYVTTTILLSVFGFTGFAYLVVMGISGAIWLFLAIGGFRTSNDSTWARNMFFFSLISVLILCIAISADSFLPTIWK